MLSKQSDITTKTPLIVLPGSTTEKSTAPTDKDQSDPNPQMETKLITIKSNYKSPIHAQTPNPARSNHKKAIRKTIIDNSNKEGNLETAKLDKLNRTQFQKSDLSAKKRQDSADWIT